MESIETRRRLRAARMLAAPSDAELKARAGGDPSRGITVEELAVRLQGEWPVSAKTIGAIERGERQVRTMELRTIAAACGLPFEFFTADLTVLAGAPAMNGTEERLDELFNRLETVLSRPELLAQQEREEVREVRPRGRSGSKTARGKRAARKTGGA